MAESPETRILRPPSRKRLPELRPGPRPATTRDQSPPTQSPTKSESSGPPAAAAASTSAGVHHPSPSDPTPASPQSGSHASAASPHTPPHPSPHILAAPP